MEEKITLLKPSFWSTPTAVDSVVLHREKLSSRLELAQAEIKRLVGLIEFKDSALKDEAEFLEEFLSGPKSVTYESLRRRVSQLRGAAGRSQGGL